jgi:DNA-binding NarL/FixJ family response regulator
LHTKCAAVDAAAPRGPLHVIIAGSRGGGEEIGLALNAFVVEDNESIRESLIEALAELAGIRTLGIAATEKAAVAWLSDAANDWDIAIVDLILEPGGNGLGVLRAVGARRPDQKVVVLTGTANPDVRKRCEALGSDGVFDKAMETDALIDYCIDLANSRQK